MKLRGVFGLSDTNRYQKSIIIITFILMFGIVFVGVTMPKIFSEWLNNTFNWVVHYFGWWFMLLGVVLLGFVFFIAFSRYGQIRIGGPDAEPEFDTFSWISMVFTAGFGPAIFIWGVGEPISLMNNQPPNMAIANPKSTALAFMYFHDAFPGAAMWYFPLALGFAVMIYIHGTENYRLSSLLERYFNKKRYGWLYWLVDFITLVAIIGGLITALGFTSQQLTALLSNVLGMKDDIFSYGVYTIIGLILIGDIWLGLEKGLRNAARITMVLIGLSMVFLFIVGPTLFTLNIWLDATGVMLTNLPRFLTYTAPIAEGDWPQQWTAFWWAYWASFSLFVGSFVARISKGRTIRETFAAVVFAPAALAWIQHAILGGWVLSPRNIGPISDALKSGGFPAALAKAVTLTPFEDVLGAMLVIVSIGYIITTIDSGVYMISALSLGEESPNKRIRTWGAIITALLGMMTLSMPTFSAIQSFSPIMGLPFTLIFVLIIYATYDVLHSNYEYESLSSKSINNKKNTASILNDEIDDDDD